MSNSLNFSNKPAEFNITVQLNFIFTTSHPKHFKGFAHEHGQTGLPAFKTYLTRQVFTSQFSFNLNTWARDFATATEFIIFQFWQLILNGDIKSYAKEIKLLMHTV